MSLFPAPLPAPWTVTERGIEAMASHDLRMIVRRVEDEQRPYRCLLEKRRENEWDMIHLRYRANSMENAISYVSEQAKGRIWVFGEWTDHGAGSVIERGAVTVHGRQHAYRILSGGYGNYSLRYMLDSEGDEVHFKSANDPMELRMAILAHFRKEENASAL